jgi:hypothetical protein
MWIARVLVAVTNEGRSTYPLWLSHVPIRILTWEKYKMVEAGGVELGRQVSEECQRRGRELPKRKDIRTHQSVNSECK